MSSAGLLLIIISLAQVLYYNPFSWAHWLILEIVFVPGWMIVNSCRLEQLCISLQNTKFVVWAEILTLQTHRNVSNSRLRVAGMIVWTAEAYCSNSCVSLPWCTLVAWHKHLWVQLRKTGNGSGMLAWRKSSCCPLLAYLCALDIVTLSTSEVASWQIQISLYTAALLSEKTTLRSRRHIIWDIGFHSTGSWFPKVDKSQNPKGFFLLTEQQDKN